MDQHLIEDSTAARFIVRVEPDGRRVHVEATEAAAGWYGLPREAMIGRTPAEILPPIAALKLQRALDRCIASRRSVSLRQSHAANMALRGVRWRLTPSLDAGGKVRFVEARLHDEPGALAAIRAQHADAVKLLTGILQISEIGLCLIDDRGCFVQVNDAFAELAGVPQSELIGHSFTRLLPQSDRAAASQWYAGTLLGRDPPATEWRIMRPDGGRIAASITAARVRLSDGSDYQIVSTIDLGNQRRLETEVRILRDNSEASAQAKSQFLANMSHALRTPLNAIIGFSEIIRDEMLGPIGTRQYSEYARDIHLSGQSLLELIDDVLDTARIDVGRLEISDKAIDVQWLLADIHRLLAERADEAGVRLIVDIPRAPPHLRGDERRLRQMLLNIVSNGIKFAAEGGVVILDSVCLEGGRFAFRIKDSGGGISLEELPMVVEAFRHSSRNDPTLARNQGAGMGLPLAKAIAEAHGGALLIDRVTVTGRPGMPGEMTEIMALLPAERVMAPAMPGHEYELPYDLFTTGGINVPDRIDSMDEDTFQNLTVGALLLDRHGRILRCNQVERHFRQRAPETLIGHDFFREIAPETRSGDFHERLKQGTRRGRQCSEFEFTFNLPNRPTKAWVHMRSGARPNSTWLLVRWV